MVFEFLYNKVITELEHNLANKLYYHGVHHTIDVVNSAERIAKLEGLNNQDIDLIKLAALFHDAGFCKQHNNNEQLGADYARLELEKLRFEEHKISKVEQIILSTKLGHEPQGYLQQIMSDADFDYLGRNDFHKVSETLRQELNAYGKTYTIQKWDEVQYRFLVGHEYYTATSKKTRLPKKLDNLEEIKTRIASYK